jgi:hypothetical protein
MILQNFRYTAPKRVADIRYTSKFLFISVKLLLYFLQRDTNFCNAALYKFYKILKVKRLLTVYA